MKLKFKTGDTVKFQCENNGDIWEVLECKNISELESVSFEDLLSMKFIPIYRCKTIDHYGKEIINNIAENLIEKAN